MKSLRIPNGRELSQGGLVVGLFLIWKYRYQIQEKLESVGIRTPWLGKNLDSTVRSGGAKVSGAIKRGLGADQQVSL